MTDNAGNQIGTTVKYPPFGETRLGSVPTDKLFTGQRLDGTGLYYYNARYYDPTIGRFISADTIIPNPANPQCFNRYSYCLNNPLKYTDPSGKYVEIEGMDISTTPTWMFGMFMTTASISTQKNVAATVHTYVKFRELSPVTAHMAWTMEQSTIYTININVDAKTAVNEGNYWTAVVPTDSGYTLSLNPEMFSPVTAPVIGAGTMFFNAVDTGILNTQPNYDIGSAIWEETVGEVLSINNKVEAVVNIIEYFYQTKTNNPLISGLDVAASSSIPLYDFFSNLIRQKDYYDSLMISTNTPYPFRR
jgi:RHS repeat-associated protein